MRCVIPSALLAAALLAATVSSAQEATTEERLDRIERELAEIKQILLRLERSGPAARPAPPREALVNVGGEPTLGKAAAPVTLVEFTDYQCPYCARFFNEALPELKRDYIDKGKLKLVVKDLPLSMHPHAQRAAEASHCAGDQGRFWEMHDALFANYRELDENRIRELGRKIGLEMPAFELCLSAGLHRDAVLGDATEARRHRITGTPTFVLGSSDGDTLRGEVIRGFQGADAMKARIDALLKTAAD
jgi:protein-disulfide isomerase